MGQHLHSAKTTHLRAFSFGGVAGLKKVPSLMVKNHTPKFRRLNVNRMVPNALTLLALCAGMTSIRMALTDRWELAVAAVIAAMILDGLDGRIARLMKANSEFGAQLDSLSDVINFGVAPALIVYHWSLIEVRGLGWAIALLLTICCALRLARFNANLGNPNKPPWASRFFTGVPAPAGAGLALLPLILSFEFGDAFFQSPIVNLVTMAGTGALMISTIPTFSGKSVHLPHYLWGPVLIVIAVLLAFLVSTPWITLGLVGVLYAGSIPVSFITYQRMVSRHEKSEGPGPKSDKTMDKETKATDSETDGVVSEGSAEITQLPPRDKAKG